MKNLSKRNKTLLGIGAVIVVVVAGLLLLKPPPIDQLLGASVVSITPENPTIRQGQTIQLSAKPAALCTWSSQAGVSVGSAGASTTVQGISVGTFKVSAKCPLGTASTSVTVVAPPTPTPLPPTAILQGDTDALGINLTKTLSTTTGESCTWSKGDCSISLMFQGANPAASITIRAGSSAGTCTVTMSCPSGSTDSILVTVCDNASSNPDLKCGARPSG